MTATFRGSGMKERVQHEYERWVDRAKDMAQGELAAMASDPAALEDAFYRDLAFGTGGLRGIIGLGPNRMNVYTVAKATQGLADYLNARFESPSVAIARDSRRMGEEFVHVTAEVLAANGIRSVIYPRIEPTPALSFAVRDRGCSAGVCITASHNPAEYSGYKVYGSDGCQITTEAAAAIQAAIDAVDVFDDVKRMPFDDAEAAGLASWMDDAVLSRYVDAVLAQSHGVDCAELKVAYTPLHGAGSEAMLRVLADIGVAEPAVEPAQSVPDGAFPTCSKPNPEERAALELGLALAERERADILIASDPDADRLGVAVRHNGEYVLLNGNDAGMLMLDFLCRTGRAAGRDLRDAVAVTTVVSAPMADAMAADYGFELRRTLTGFKFIGEQIGLLEAAEQADRFLFGFEESCGYLAGTYVRDKDAMVAAMILCQAAAGHRSRGRDLVEALDELRERYGHWHTALLSFSYPGVEGTQRMAGIMAGLRADHPVRLACKEVVAMLDYLPGLPMPIVGGDTSLLNQVLPSADVLELRLEDGAKVIVRPSGTEPKVKAYLSVCGKDEKDARVQINELVKAVNKIFE